MIIVTNKKLILHTNTTFLHIWITQYLAQDKVSMQKNYVKRCGSIILSVGSKCGKPLAKSMVKTPSGGNHKTGT